MKGRCDICNKYVNFLSNNICEYCHDKTYGVKRLSYSSRQAEMIDSISSLINAEQKEKALEIVKKGIEEAPHADFFFYASVLIDDVDESLYNIETAWKMNKINKAYTNQLLVAYDAKFDATEHAELDLVKRVRDVVLDINQNLTNGFYKEKCYSSLVRFLELFTDFISFDYDTKKNKEIMEILEEMVLLYFKLVEEEKKWDPIHKLKYISDSHAFDKSWKMFYEIVEEFKSKWRRIGAISEDFNRKYINFWESKIENLPYSKAIERLEKKIKISQKISLIMKKNIKKKDEEIIEINCDNVFSKLDFIFLSGIVLFFYNILFFFIDKVDIFKPINLGFNLWILFYGSIAASPYKDRFTGKNGEIKSFFFICYILSSIICPSYLLRTYGDKNVLFVFQVPLIIIISEAMAFYKNFFPYRVLKKKRKKEINNNMLNELKEVEIEMDKLLNK